LLGIEICDPASPPPWIIAELIRREDRFIAILSPTTRITLEMIKEKPNHFAADTTLPSIFVYSFSNVLFSVNPSIVF
jgi:hypothetical protein